MQNPSDEIKFIFVAKKTRILGIAILLGIFLVFFAGLFVSGNNINLQYEYLNRATLILCIILCGFSVYVRKLLLKRVNSKNFINKYFNASVIPFGLCNLGGLLCVMTSLFINQNILFAVIGVLISAIAILINFPKDNDYKKLGI